MQISTFYSRHSIDLAMHEDIYITLLNALKPNITIIYVEHNISINKKLVIMSDV